MVKYDIILVGAGIANISFALQFINSDKKVLLVEKGNAIYSRHCPKAQIGKCVNCKPACQITTGFAGAGCFSDTKLTYSPAVGGTLVDYVGTDNFNSLLDVVDNMFNSYGAKGESVFDSEFADKFQYECSKYGLKFIKSKVRHLGTDGSYEVMTRIYDALNSASNIDIKCNTDVIDCDFTNKLIYTSSEAYSADYISIAVGRYGSEWLRAICQKQSIKLINDTVDIGVRVECPRAVTDFITDKLYEFKITNYSSSDNAARTFCVNPGGYVVQENYDDIKCVNGHSYANNKSLNTNFAILVSSHFTEPFNQPIAYGKRICELANMLADGKPMVQRLVDLKAKKRSTTSRMKRLSITPTLTDAQPGDLRYALPANIIDSIVEAIDSLANVIPNINGKNTILYAPEVKFYSSKIDLNHNLQNNKYKDVFFLGDSSGVTHGIIQSAMSGIYAANIIKGK